MNITTILADEASANIIRNFYPLYLHDLSEFDGSYPNEFGIYEEEPMKTLEEQYHVQDTWFEKPDLLYPYIIFMDSRPVGFMLVSTGSYAPKDTDYYVYEFFISRPYRGKNIAETAAIQVFDRFQGKWQLYTNTSELNTRAQQFWQKTIQNYTLGNFQKNVGQTPFGEKIIFTFSNAK